MSTNAQAADDDDALAIGWITPVLHKIAYWATYPRRLCIGDHLLIDLSHADAVAESHRRARRADAFVATCMVLDLVCIGLIAGLPDLRVWLVVPFLTWRVTDVVFTALHASLFGEFLQANQRLVKLAPSRVVTLGLVSYLELALCFGGIYSCWPELVQSNQKDFLTPFHLSFITQLTIGYGDAAPLGNLRIVTWLQGMCSIILVAFLVEKFVGELRRSGR